MPGVNAVSISAPLPHGVSNNGVSRIRVPISASRSVPSLSAVRQCWMPSTAAAAAPTMPASFFSAAATTSVRTFSNGSQ
jgi:hypothetical protein